MMVTNASAHSLSQVFENFTSEFNIHGKNVLEVGGIIEENLIRNFNLKWVSVDPLYTPLENYKLVNSQASTIVQHINEDITNVSFEQNKFDYIFSCNAFHHISNLELAFNNFYKWLKKGGVLYSHFGPIGSAPDGCHIEGLEHEGKIYNFWEYKLVPFWSHLHFQYEEMMNFLKQYYSTEFAIKLAHVIYKSNWINRLTFSAYKDLLNNNPWEVINFSYSEGVDYKPKNCICSVSTEFEEKLLKQISKENKKENFLARDLLIVIRK